MDASSGATRGDGRSRGSSRGFKTSGGWWSATNTRTRTSWAWRSLAASSSCSESVYEMTSREISLKALRRGERFRVGEVAFEYRGPRSVCRYIEQLTEPGMTQALKGRGGICASVMENGTVRVGDEIEVVQPAEERP